LKLDDQILRLSLEASILPVYRLPSGSAGSKDKVVRLEWYKAAAIGCWINSFLSA